jgi:SAM-dependent methyltransferase
VGFNQLARPYRWLEWAVFGGRLQRARCAHMQTFLEAESILLLGEGDGRFLEALLAAGCRAKIVCVDASPTMLNLAAQRTAGNGQGSAARGIEVRFLNGDARNFRLPEGFRPDVVGAHFFLDCFREEELLVIAANIARWSVPGAKVIVTDFTVPDGRWVWRFRGRLLIYWMLLFFRIFTGISARRLPDLHSLLINRGWDCRKKVIFDHGLICSWVMEMSRYERS